MSFQDIKGQNTAIEILRGQIRTSSLTNGYLFCGPQGIGKKALALTLAKALNCQEGGVDSCDRCPSCLKIVKGNHPDVRFFGSQAQDGQDESQIQAIKIEDIRQLQNDISLRAYEGRKKVFIVDNAHNLTAEAQGALLKILEEPPGASVIALITAKPSLLFKTIVSRCKVIKLYPLSRNELEGILRRDYAVDTDTAHFLAYFCEGRLGSALGLKDDGMLMRKNRIIDILVFARQLKFEELSVKGRLEVKYALNILAAWFRDMYLLKAGMPPNELINLDRGSELQKSIRHFTFLDLEEIMESICDSVSYLEQNANIRLLLSNLKEEIICRVRKAPA